MRNKPSISGSTRPEPNSARLLALLSLVVLPVAMHAQFSFTTNSGTLSVVAYTGAAGSIAIPNTVDGLPVTSIGASAFAQSWSLTDVAIPSNVTSIESSAFANCTNLDGVFFQGNSPALSASTVFVGDSATVYYTSGTTGWGLLFGGLPTVLLNPQSLRVTIAPAAAISTGAKWAVDGSAWQNSGGIVANLPVGDHTVSFNAVDGWTAPADQTVTITTDQGTTAKAVYTFVGNYGLVTNGGFETGDFTGWTWIGNPGSAFADDGSQSGTIPHMGRYEAALGQAGSLGFLSQTLSTVPGANYSVSFRVSSDGQTPNRFLASWNGNSLLDATNLPAVGWTNVQLLASATGVNSVLQFGFQDDKGYLELDDVSVLPAPANAGALQVTILPPGAVTSGAQWQIDGGTEQPSGANILGLTVGNHTVSFTAVGGWTKPANQNVTIKNGQTAAISGLYAFVPNYGLVTNGGFETRNFSGWTLSGDPTATFVDDGTLSGITPQSEHYAAALGEAGALGYLSQTIKSTPGANYLLSFWVNSDGQTPNRFLASWNGKTLVDQLNLPAIGWTNMQFTVNATGTNSALRFGCQDDNSYLGLDNVSILLAPTPITMSGVGMHTNQFGFAVAGPIGLTVVVEANTNLANPTWTAIQTNVLGNGLSFFNVPQAINYPARFFRLRW